MSGAAGAPDQRSTACTAVARSSMLEPFAITWVIRPSCRAPDRQGKPGVPLAGPARPAARALGAVLPWPGAAARMPGGRPSVR
ncbi:hypothetical protein GCM10023347_39230 [Streptomyces chumphonensis]